MQNIIKHKRIGSISILMILVIVFAMSIAKSVEADNDKTFLFEFAPTGFAPGEYGQVGYHNSICSESTPTTLSVFNADNGELVAASFLGNIKPLKGAIKSFFYPNGPPERKNIVARICISCPSKSLIHTAGQDPPVSLEIVDSDSNITKRILKSFTVLETQCSDLIIQ